MGLFSILSNRMAYDRSRILDAAGRARAKKKRARAIELYRRVLAHEPQNGDLHAKIAPLLAETGQQFDAWTSFKAVARGCLREGYTDKALGVYREATLYLPCEVQAWQAVAQLQHKRGQSGEAVETLLEGSRQFRTRWLRPQAIHLLKRARELEAWNFEVVIELARLLTMSGQRHEAHWLLNGLAEHSSEERLRRVRAVQFLLVPGPRNAWRWLQAAIGLAPAARADNRVANARLKAARRPTVRSAETRAGVVRLHAARRR